MTWTATFSFLIYFHGNRAGQYKVRSLDIDAEGETPRGLVRNAMAAARECVCAIPQPKLADINITTVDGKSFDAWKHAHY